MRHKKLTLCVILWLGLGLTGLHAQETIPASGGDASGSGGSVSYTVGQLVYTTNIATGIGSVAHGVQQPYEISVVTGTKEIVGINLNCRAYPNPTSDYLILQLENYSKENLSYQLFDISGKLLENKKLTDNETTITMENLVSTTYFLKVTDNQKVVKTFKIIKN